jgi:hypothetical protein
MCGQNCKAIGAQTESYASLGLQEREGAKMSLQAFQAAARQRGFVEVNESGEGTVLWLKKKAPDMTRETHQRMCIDGLTNSVTVYWMTVPGKVNSKTFRGVPALQEWFDLKLETIVQR